MVSLTYKKGQDNGNVYYVWIQVFIKIVVKKRYVDGCFLLRFDSIHSL